MHLDEESAGSSELGGCDGSESGCVCGKVVVVVEEEERKEEVRLMGKEGNWE